MSEPVLESAAAPLQQHAHRSPMCKNSHREKKNMISVISSQGDTELGTGECTTILYISSSVTGMCVS